MNYFERLLMNYLRDSKIEIEISGFDMESFESVLRQELKCRLEMVEYIAFEDEEFSSDADKVKAIKRLFQENFYNEE